MLLALTNISEELTLQSASLSGTYGKMCCWMQDDWVRCHGILLALSNVSEELMLQKITTVNMVKIH